VVGDTDSRGRQRQRGAWRHLLCLWFAIFACLLHVPWNVTFTLATQTGAGALSRHGDGAGASDFSASTEQSASRYLAERHSTVYERKVLPLLRRAASVAAGGA